MIKSTERECYVKCVAQTNDRGGAIGGVQAVCSLGEGTMA